MKQEMHKANMSEGRGMLTEREREAIMGNVSESYKYKTRSYFRKRLSELEEDVRVLAKHDRVLLQEMKEVVCENGEQY
jgi:hypothetical protein